VIHPLPNIAPEKLLSFAQANWKWLVGGLCAVILGIFNIRLMRQQTRESRLRIRELEARLDASPDGDPAKNSARAETPNLPGFEKAASFTGYDYTKVILDSQDLLVVLNDGRSWVSAYREALHKRAAELKRPTRVCLIHPLSPYIDLLIRKNGKTKATQVAEIEKSYRILSAQASEGAGTDVRGHMNPSPYVIFLTEGAAIVDPYLFHEAGTLPMLIFRKGDEIYETYRQDAEKLYREAKPLGPTDFQSEGLELKASGTT
jgi:hypothetical protein